MPDHPQEQRSTQHHPRQQTPALPLDLWRESYAVSSEYGHSATCVSSIRRYRR
jgi:hypothetical protein